MKLDYKGLLIEKCPFVYIFIYRFFLDFVYFEYLSPNNSNLGSGLYDYRSIEHFFYSWVLIIVSYPFFRYWIDLSNNYGSTLALFYIYIISYIPFTTCVYAGIITHECMMMNAVYFFLLFLFHWISGNWPIRKPLLLMVNRKVLTDKALWGIIIVVLFSIIYISYTYTNFRLHFDLYNVYGLRAEAEKYSVPTVFEYILEMSATVLPIVFGYCLLKRRYFLAGVLWLGQFLHFGINGAKGVFYTPIVVLLIVILYRKKNMRQFKLFSLSCLLGVELLSILELMIRGYSIIMSWFIRRIFFVPNRLHEVYFQFFSSHEADFFRSSFLRHFGFFSPYARSGGISREIGIFYGSQSNANNGLFSDAIANLGGYGIIIMPLLIVFILRLFDKCTMKLDKRLTTAAAFLLAMSLRGSSLFTMLLSHGMLLMMFCMILIRRDRNIIELDGKTTSDV